MTVHVLIPVFNRLALTQQLVDCMRRQQTDQAIELLIVDDGSTDGTDAWLSLQKDIRTVQGNGSLFWGGAIDVALKQLKALASADDWVLLMNNDTTVDVFFVQHLIDTARAHGPAAVGSVIRDESSPAKLLSIGAHIDPWRLVTRDLLDISTLHRDQATVSVDALSGRGVLFPIASILAVAGMRPRALPHYLADYELSVRVRKAGWKLLVSTAAAVYSTEDYGSTRRAMTWRERLLSVRSPAYLPALFVFWWGASNWLQRLTLPLRLPLFLVFPRLRKNA